MRNYKYYLPEAEQTASLLHDQNRLRIITAGEEGFALGGGDGMLRAMLGVEKELYDKGQFDGYSLATIYCLAGDKLRALGLLTAAIANHDERDIALRIDQDFAGLHDDPEFRKMIVQIGLPPLE